MAFLSRSQQGALYAISSGLCYGFIGYFGFTIINSGLSVFNMLFWRFLVSTLMILILLIPQYQTLLSFSKKSLKVLFYGMAFYSATSIAYFMGSQYIGTGLAMVIFFTYPAIVVVFNSLFYRTKIAKIYYLAFLMIILGMICLADMRQLTFDILGIGLAALSAVFYASYILVSKKTKVDPKVSTLMVSMGSMITCFMAAWADFSFDIPSGFNIWFNIAAMAFVCTALPILLLLQALKYISAEKTSILSVLEPVCVVILGVILLDEKITNLQVIGVVVVLLGSLMTLTKEKGSVLEFDAP